MFQVEQRTDCLENLFVDQLNGVKYHNELTDQFNPSEANVTELSPVQPPLVVSFVVFPFKSDMFQMKVLSSARSFFQPCCHL